MSACEPCGGLVSTVVLRDVLGFGADAVRCEHCGVLRYDRAVRTAREVNDGPEARAAQDRFEAAGSMGLAPDPARAEAAREQVREEYRSLLGCLTSVLGRLPRSLFEVGFGLGAFMETAKDAGVSGVSGCEPNLRAVKNLRARCPRVGAVHAFFREVPVPPRDRAVDAVVMLDVMEHTETPRTDLERARRFLRPGGVVLLKTFYQEFHAGLPGLDVEGPASRANYGVFERAGYFDPLGHLHHFPRAQIPALLERTGFRPVLTRDDAAWGQLTVVAERAL